MNKSIPDWVQEALFATTEVYELRLRVGIMPQHEHAQWHVELTDPTDGRLIAAEACPHLRADDPAGVLAQAADAGRAMLEEQIGPF